MTKKISKVDGLLKTINLDPELMEIFEESEKTLGTSIDPHRLVNLYIGEGNKRHLAAIIFPDATSEGNVIFCSEYTKKEEAEKYFSKLVEYFGIENTNIGI